MDRLLSLGSSTPNGRSCDRGQLHGHAQQGAAELHFLWLGQGRVPARLVLQPRVRAQHERHVRRQQGPIRGSQVCLAILLTCLDGMKSMYLC